MARRNRRILDSSDDESAEEEIVPERILNEALDQDEDVDELYYLIKVEGQEREEWIPATLLQDRTDLIQDWKNNQSEQTQTANEQRNIANLQQPSVPTPASQAALDHRSQHPALSATSQPAVPSIISSRSASIVDPSDSEPLIVKKARRHLSQTHNSSNDFMEEDNTDEASVSDYTPSDDGNYTRKTRGRNSFRPTRAASIRSASAVASTTSHVVNRKVVGQPTIHQTPQPAASMVPSTPQTVATSAQPKSRPDGNNIVVAARKTIRPVTASSSGRGAQEGNATSAGLTVNAVNPSIISAGQRGVTSHNQETPPDSDTERRIFRSPPRHSMTLQSCQQHSLIETSSADASDEDGRPPNNKPSTSCHQSRTASSVLSGPPLLLAKNDSRRSSLQMSSFRSTSSTLMGSISTRDAAKSQNARAAQVPVSVVKAAAKSDGEAARPRSEGGGLHRTVSQRQAAHRRSIVEKAPDAAWQESQLRGLSSTRDATTLAPHREFVWLPTETIASRKASLSVQQATTSLAKSSTPGPASMFGFEIGSFPENVGVEGREVKQDARNSIASNALPNQQTVGLIEQGQDFHNLASEVRSNQHSSTLDASTSQMSSLDHRQPRHDDGMTSRKPLHHETSDFRRNWVPSSPDSYRPNYGDCGRANPSSEQQARAPNGQQRRQPHMVSRNHKLTVCRYWKAGDCWRGESCLFAHGEPDRSDPHSVHDGFQAPTEPRAFRQALDGTYHAALSRQQSDRSAVFSTSSSSHDEQTVITKLFSFSSNKIKLRSASDSYHYSQQLGFLSGPDDYAARLLLDREAAHKLLKHEIYSCEAFLDRFAHHLDESKQLPIGAFLDCDPASASSKAPTTFLSPDELGVAELRDSLLVFGIATEKTCNTARVHRLPLEQSYIFCRFLRKPGSIRTFSRLFDQQLLSLITPELIHLARPATGAKGIDIVKSSLRPEQSEHLCHILKALSSSVQLLQDLSTHKLSVERLLILDEATDPASIPRIDHFMLKCLRVHILRIHFDSENKLRWQALFSQPEVLVITMSVIMEQPKLSGQIMELFRDTDLQLSNHRQMMLPEGIRAIVNEKCNSAEDSLSDWERILMALDSLGPSEEDGSLLLSTESAFFPDYAAKWQRAPFQAEEEMAEHLAAWVTMQKHVHRRCLMLSQYAEQLVPDGRGSYQKQSMLSAAHKRHKLVTVISANDWFEANSKKRR